MADKKIWMGILVMVLTFGMAVLGCTSDNENTFTLSIAVADGSSGMGSVSITSGGPTGNAAGASVTVNATPSTDHHFVKWSNNIAGMDSVSSDNPYTFNITADSLLFAIFAPDDNVTGVFSFNGIWVVDGIETIISGNTWQNDYDNGTFTVEGNYGLIYSNTLKANIGMFAITSATTITAYLVPPNPKPGTIHVTKKQ
jgi:hypothetical protein